jgi:hypothetical protein
MAYTKKAKDEIIKNICLNISNNNASLRDSLNIEGMPDKNQFYRWLRENDEFRERYARAREARAESLFEEILEIADDSTMDKKNIKGEDVVDTEVVQRSRLRIDARKWVLSKMQPKKYGDKIDMTTNGNDISTNQIDYGKLSQEALEEIARADKEDNN